MGNLKLTGIRLYTVIVAVLTIINALTFLSTLPVEDTSKIKAASRSLASLVAIKIMYNGEFVMNLP